VFEIQNVLVVFPTKSHCSHESMGSFFVLHTHKHDSHFGFVKRSYTAVNICCPFEPFLVSAFVGKVDILKFFAISDFIPLTWNEPSKLTLDILQTIFCLSVANESVFCVEFYCEYLLTCFHLSVFIIEIHIRVNIELKERPNLMDIPTFTVVEIV